ncbi:hypothetical protein JCM11491_006509 [Sporobolomyces phaffii]
MGCAESRLGERRLGDDYRKETAHAGSSLLFTSSPLPLAFDYCLWIFDCSTTVKTLMLGPGESGKSTVVKQLRLAYSRTWSLEERIRFKEVVFQNSLQSMQATIFGFGIAGVPFPSSRLAMAAFLSSLKAEDVLDATTSDFNPSIARAIACLWTESATKEVVSKRSGFQLNDSAAYFFDALPRTSQSGYLPTDEDILRTRVRSTGIVEETIQLERTKVVIVDVGGQRSERRKWVMCFENVQLLIFVAAISEFDQYLAEDPTQPRLAETLLLWQSIASSRWFTKTAFVLFLNKLDIFSDKVAGDPDSVRLFLKEYDGPPSDVNSISLHLLSKFKALHRTNRALFCHFTTATDTTAIRPVLSAVMEAVVTAALSQVGIL